jgi:phage-related protein
VAFEIEEGVVEVTAEVNRSSLARSAKAAGEQAGEEAEKGTRSGFERSSRQNRNSTQGILRRMFTPDTATFSALRAPFTAALSTPVGAAVIAVAGTAALAFVGAFAAAIATAGLGAVFIGIGAAAVAGNKRLQSAFGDTVNQLKRTMSQAARPLINPLIQALGIVRATIRDLGPQFREVFGFVAQAIVPLAEGVRGFAKGFMDALTADPAALEGMRDALIAVGANLPRLGVALGELFAMLAKNENNVRNIGILFTILEFSIVSLGTSITILSKLLDWIVFGWGKIIDAGSAAVSWITGTAVPAITGAFGAVVGFFQAIPGWVSSAWGSVSGFFVNLWNTISTFTVNLVTTVVGFFVALPGRIMAAIVALPGLVVSFFSNMLSQAAYTVGFLIGSIVQFFIDLPGRVVQAVTALPGLVAGIFTTVRNTAVSLVSSMISTVLSFLSSIPERAYAATVAIVSRLLSVFSSARNTANSAASSLVSGVVNILTQLPGKAAGAVSAVTGRIKNALQGAVSAAYGIGRDIVSGLIRGMASLLGSVWNKAKELGNAAKEGFKDALRIGSPSKVFAELGVNTLQGLVKGLSQTEGVERAMDRLTHAVVHGGGFSATAPVGPVAPVGGGFTLPPPPPSSSSGSATRMAPSFDVKVYVGDREIRDVVRVEINEHDRGLDRQVSAGTGGFRL